MALADREYIRNPSRPPVGVMHMWSVTTWIIVINVAVFILSNVLVAVRVDPQTGQVVGDGGRSVGERRAAREARSRSSRGR